jgi:hypothetical protein
MLEEITRTRRLIGCYLYQFRSDRVYYMSLIASFLETVSRLILDCRAFPVLNPQPFLLFLVMGHFYVHGFFGAFTIPSGVLAE